MPANSTGSGKPRSFFGYYNSQETKIAKIVINTPGLYATGNQFYLDDLSVILPICSDNPMIGDLNNDCYVNVADLNFLVLNWLTYNDPN
jgi:hypothetical protein